MTHTTLPAPTKIRKKGYLFYFFGASYMREKGGGFGLLRERPCFHAPKLEVKVLRPSFIYEKQSRTH